MRQRFRAVAGSVAALVIALTPAAASADAYWQCVPFARLVSGIQIFGDAYTWWSQAAGQYPTGFTPKTGAVLCFKPSGRMRLAMSPWSARCSPTASSRSPTPTGR